MTEKREKPGPKSDRVNIDSDWEEAVKKALEKKRPKDGWPNGNDKSHSEADNDLVEPDYLYSPPTVIYPVLKPLFLMGFQ